MDGKLNEFGKRLEELALCGFEMDATPDGVAVRLADHPAFEALVAMASDRHALASCLAEIFVEMAVRESVLYCLGEREDQRGVVVVVRWKDVHEEHEEREAGAVKEIERLRRARGVKAVEYTRAVQEVDDLRRRLDEANARLDVTRAQVAREPAVGVGVTGAEQTAGDILELVLRALDDLDRIRRMGFYTPGQLQEIEAALRSRRLEVRFRFDDEQMRQIVALEAALRRDAERREKAHRVIDPATGTGLGNPPYAEG